MSERHFGVASAAPLRERMDKLDTSAGACLVALFVSACFVVGLAFAVMTTAGLYAVMAKLQQIILLLRERQQDETPK